MIGCVMRTQKYATALFVEISAVLRQSVADKETLIRRQKRKLIKN